MIESNLPYFTALFLILVATIHIEHYLMVTRPKHPFSELSRFVTGLVTVVAGTASGYVVGVIHTAEELLVLLLIVSGVCGGMYLVNSYMDALNRKRRNVGTLVSEVKRVMYEEKSEQDWRERS